MTGLLGLFFRQFLAASLFIVLAFGLGCLVANGDTPESQAAVCGAGRLSAYLAMALLLVLETEQLNRQVSRRGRMLDEAGRAAPSRVETLLEGWGSWALVMVVVIVLLIGRSCVSAAGADRPRGLEILLLTFFGRWALWLVLASITKIRFWWASWGLHSPSGVATAAPLLVATQVAFGLMVVSARLPHAGLMKAGLLLVWLMVRPNQASTTGDVSEFLVELGADDTIMELSPTLVLHGAHAERAASSASWADSPSAHQTYLITVPTLLAPLFLVDLVFDEGNAENVVDIELNEVVSPGRGSRAEECVSSVWGGPTSDPLSGAQSWLREVRADVVIEALSRPPDRYGNTNRSAMPERVRVAVVDLGIDHNHEDLRGVVSNGVHEPVGSHGTSLAGITAATTGNRRGIASLNVHNNVIELIDVPALAARRPGADDVAQGIFKAVDLKADVILLAFGVPGVAPSLVDEAVAHARREGVVLVAAAGNDGPENSASDQWPANMEGMLVVSALNAGRPAWFSNSLGETLGVYAPGTGLCTTQAGGGYWLQSGTSMAAAVVAGQVALRKRSCPYDSERQLVGAMYWSAEQNGSAAVPIVNFEHLANARCLAD